VRLDGKHQRAVDLSALAGRPRRDSNPQLRAVELLCEDRPCPSGFQELDRFGAYHGSYLGVQRVSGPRCPRSPVYIPRRLRAAADHRPRGVWLAAWARALRELIGAALGAPAEALNLLGSCLDALPGGGKATRSIAARPATGRTEGHRRHPSCPAARDSPGYSPRVAARSARALPLACEQPDAHPSHCSSAPATGQSPRT
jgi:hypothetical protein